MSKLEINEELQHILDIIAKYDTGCANCGNKQEITGSYTAADVT